MKKFLFIIFILCIISPVFAEDTIFTNDDLKIYSDEYLKHQKPAEQKNSGREDNNNNPNDRLEGQQRTLSGKSCDVLDFSSHKINYAIHNPEYEIRGTVTKQTIAVHIKSNSHTPLLVENIYVSVLLDDGTTQTKQLEPAAGDSLESSIQPDTEYTGYVTIDGDIPIVSAGCRVME